MRTLSKPLALTGFFVVFFSTIFCPFLKVPLQANWNLYQVDVALYMITNGLLGLTVLLFFMRKLSVFRLSASVLIAWVIISFLMVYLQINNYIGLKFLDGLISKTLNIKWGWAVLLLGAFLILFSVGRTRRKQENTF